MPSGRREILAALIVGAGLSGCASPQIITSTPASVEIACAGLTCESVQAVNDLAQRHCRQYGLDAQQQVMRRSTSGNEWATFNCVNNTGAPVAALPR